jgi:RNA polymerase sigma factor (sigma-70 family)
MARILQNHQEEVYTMVKILNRIALALAGLGLLTGSAGADIPAKLHDEVRHRIIEKIGVDDVSADAVRAALGEDPDFELLLEYYFERSLNGFRSSHHADDALQQTMMKIWKGRPQIFLRPHDEVVKYLQTSAKRNFFTEISKIASLRDRTGNQQIDVEEISHPRICDPAEEAATRDLYNELVSRLSRTEQEVLEVFLSGTSSQRKIAGEMGISRYAVSQSIENIKQELRALLQETGIPVERE